MSKITWMVSKIKLPKKKKKEEIKKISREYKPRN